MKKTFIFIFLLIVLVGCKPLCSKPYLEYKKGECCLDKDNNSICDSDEIDNSKINNAINVDNSPINNTCPFDCCVFGKYEVKLCETDYSCEEYKCKPIDTDKDGLTDIEEKKIGTNPKSTDTDGDKISDSDEVQRGLNPLDKNTDHDRYDDYDDKEPTRLNSAQIDITSEQAIDYKKYLDIFNEISPSPKAIFNLLKSIDNLKYRDITINVTNTGNDYSNYFSYNIATDIVFSKKKFEGLIIVGDTIIAKKRVKSENFNYQEKIDVNQKITKLNKIEIPDYTTLQNSRPPECTGINIVVCDVNYLFIIENISYEKFS